MLGGLTNLIGGPVGDVLGRVSAGSTAAVQGRDPYAATEKYDQKIQFAAVLKTMKEQGIKPSSKEGVDFLLESGVIKTPGDYMDWHKIKQEYENAPLKTIEKVVGIQGGILENKLKGQKLEAGEIENQPTPIGIHLEQTFGRKFSPDSEKTYMSVVRQFLPTEGIDLTSPDAVAQVIKKMDGGSYDEKYNNYIDAMKTADKVFAHSMGVPIQGQEPEQPAGNTENAVPQTDAMKRMGVTAPNIPGPENVQQPSRLQAIQSLKSGGQLAPEQRTLFSDEELLAILQKQLGKK